MFLKENNFLKAYHTKNCSKKMHSLSFRKTANFECDYHFACRNKKVFKKIYVLLVKKSALRPVFYLSKNIHVYLNTSKLQYIIFLYDGNNFPILVCWLKPIQRGNHHWNFSIFLFMLGSWEKGKTPIVNSSHQFSFQFFKPLFLSRLDLAPSLLKLWRSWRHHFCKGRKAFLQTEELQQAQQRTDRTGGRSLHL